MSAFYPYLSLPSIKEQATKKHECKKCFHKKLNTCINQLDVTFVLSFISLLQVAQHVSGNHVPIFRS